MQEYNKINLTLICFSINTLLGFFVFFSFDLFINYYTCGDVFGQIAAYIAIALYFNIARKLTYGWSLGWLCIDKKYYSIYLNILSFLFMLSVFFLMVYLLVSFVEVLMCVKAIILLINLGLSYIDI